MSLQDVAVGAASINAGATPETVNKLRNLLASLNEHVMFNPQVRQAIIRQFFEASGEASGDEQTAAAACLSATLSAATNYNHAAYDLRPSMLAFTQVCAAICSPNDLKKLASVLLPSVDHANQWPKDNSFPSDSLRLKMTTAILGAQRAPGAGCPNPRGQRRPRVDLATP